MLVMKELYNIYNCNVGGDCGKLDVLFGDKLYSLF